MAASSAIGDPVPSTTAVSLIRQHLLSVKVMSLSRPQLDSSPCVPLDPTDLLADAFAASMPHVGRQDVVGQTLLLPQSFENIYLGETFSFFVCIHNDSESTVTETILKADMQTSSQRVVLPTRLGDAAGGATMAADATLGDVLHHEVKEIGSHILVCTVTYSSASGERAYLRKCFKFTVGKPLDVRTKFYNAETDDVCFEAQIQNTTEAPMLLERVALEQTELYQCTALNDPDAIDTEDGDGDGAPAVCLLPNDQQQYLYQLRPTAAADASGAKRGVTSIGRLDMAWRGHMGQRGRLQTSSLQRVAPGFGDLRLTVERSPAQVHATEPFVVDCRLHNACERPLELELRLDDRLLLGLLWCSASGRRLGAVPPGHTMDVSLELLPLAAGLQTVSGVRLTDSLLGRTYEHDDIAQVFVLPAATVS